MKRCLCQTIIEDKREREQFCNRVEALGIIPTTCGRMVQAECEGSRKTLMLIGLFEQFTWHSIYAEF